MTENHTFIDADGSEQSGYQKIHDGRLQYFSLVPDFKIKIDDHFECDNTIVLIGTAQEKFMESACSMASGNFKRQGRYLAVSYSPGAYD